jgi:hypothetical protein
MKTKILFVCVVMAGIFLVSCKSGEKNNVLTAAEEAEGWEFVHWVEVAMQVVTL